MKEFYQGDILQSSSNHTYLLVLSKDFFNSETKLIVTCPIVNGNYPGATHKVFLFNDQMYSIICEQIRTMDPFARNLKKVDTINQSAIIDDAIDIVQGLFDYY